MDYYDHDEGERKQMQHSGRAARIYRSGQDESGSGGRTVTGAAGSQMRTTTARTTTKTKLKIELTIKPGSLVKYEALSCTLINISDRMLHV